MNPGFEARPQQLVPWPQAASSSDPFTCPSVINRAKDYSTVLRSSATAGADAYAKCSAGHAKACRSTQRPTQRPIERKHECAQRGGRPVGRPVLGSRVTAGRLLFFSDCGLRPKGCLRGPHNQGIALARVRRATAGAGARPTEHDAMTASLTASFFHHLARAGRRALRLPVPSPASAGPSETGDACHHCGGPAAKASTSNLWPR